MRIWGICAGRRSALTVSCRLLRPPETSPMTQECGATFSGGLVFKQIPIGSFLGKGVLITLLYLKASTARGALLNGKLVYLKSGEF